MNAVLASIRPDSWNFPLFLHVAGALKHHFLDRDNVLHRMIPPIPRRP